MKQYLIDEIAAAVESYWQLNDIGQRENAPSLYWAAGLEASRVKRLLNEYRQLAPERRRECGADRS